MVLTLTTYCFDSAPGDLESLIKPIVTTVKSATAGKILCWNCHNVITDKQQGISQNGSHIHHGINPAGYKFNFACYQEAPGCVETGQPSIEHSWFRGYSWNIAICKACSEHLGWLFEGDSRFYGLIIDRLLDSDPLSA